MILTPPDAITLSTLQTWYNLGKLVAGIGAAVVGGYKVVRWFQAIREKDLKEIHAGVARLDATMEKQTIALVGELKEVRNDLRTFYLPLASQARATPKTVKKKPAKKKTKPATKSRTKKA